MISKELFEKLATIVLGHHEYNDLPCYFTMNAEYNKVQNLCFSYKCPIQDLCMTKEKIIQVFGFININQKPFKSFARTHGYTKKRKRSY